jgi:mannose/fructose-specific phosphotransferase system component IIA
MNELRNVKLITAFNLPLIAIAMAICEDRSGQ